MKKLGVLVLVAAMLGCGKTDERDIDKEQVILKNRNDIIKTLDAAYGENHNMLVTTDLDMGGRRYQEESMEFASDYFLAKGYEIHYTKSKESDGLWFVYLRKR